MKNKIEPRFFLHATNVHHGGGATLLLSLLESRLPNLVTAQLDARMILPNGLAQRVDIKLIKAYLWDRMLAEWWLSKMAGFHDTVLCFGNMPPLFKTAGRIIVFVQNRYLIDDISLKGFPLKTRIRLQIERWWLFTKAVNVNVFVVQTPSMRKLLSRKLGLNESSIQVWPLVDKIQAGCDEVTPVPRKARCSVDIASEFIYPASGDPHKNHRRLIEAWILLATSQIFPKLYLTIDRLIYPDLCAWVDDQTQKFDMNIINLGFLPHDEILKQYTNVKALIYPSLIESFGLPLIEANTVGLPILAAELDYVRDILDPIETFDPHSSVSMARAVQRFLCLPTDRIGLLDAQMFLDRVLKHR